MSNDVKTKEKVHMDPQYIIRLTVTLLVTCMVVAAALGGVNAITADKIAATNLAKTVEAMKKVAPDATDFSDPLPITEEMTAAAESYGATLAEAYAVEAGGAPAGYTLKIDASGSQGIITMMVGVDAEGVVTGVSIVTNAETAGIGSKVMSNELLPSGVGVLDQFQGKSAEGGDLVVGSGVDAISGATVSTKGVTTGVNAALAVAGVMG